MSARTLVRISNYMSKEKLRIFMNAFLSSQFRYCALVRILHSLTLYNRIDQLQERVLRLIYDDNDFLLGVSQKRTTLRRDIQKLTIEIDRDEDVHDDASTKK